MNTTQTASDGPATSDPTIKITLDVTNYGVNVYAGPNMKPQDQGNPQAVGFLTLKGPSDPPGFEFRVSVYPDGGYIKPPFIRDGKIVDMSINHSQMARVMEILMNADAAHALYRVDNGVIHADVHGEFSRTNRPPPAPEEASSKR